MSLRFRILAGVCLYVQLQMVSAAQAPSCPKSAPSEWGASRAYLAEVRILGYLKGDELDEGALPAGPPDKEWKRGQFLYQSWNVKAGGTDMIYQVDCLYAGTERFLRLNVGEARVCTAKWKTKGDELVKGSLNLECH